jgi:hypothetical protein
MAGSFRPALRCRLDEFNAGAGVVVADHGRLSSPLLSAAGLYDPRTKSTDVMADGSSLRPPA